MERGRLASIAVGVFVVAVLLAGTSAGEAKPRGGGKVEVQQARTAGLIWLGKQKGYRLALYMPNDRVVIFYGFRTRRSREDAIDVAYSLYAVRNLGDLDRGVVRARFGSLGRVSLRFRPSGPPRGDEPPGDCVGGVETVQRGRFVGHLSFRTAGNYFHVASSGGGGSVTHSPRLRCEKGEALETSPRSLRKYVAPVNLFSDKDSIALLYASARSHGRYVGITAMHPEGSPPGAEVQLAVVEPRQGMAIGHGAYLYAPAGTLLTSLPGADPATATLSPPGPFSGKGSYSEADGAWTGNLAVKLPGARLPLTGRDFNVHLCVTNPLKDKDGCEFFKTDPPYFGRPARRGRALR